MVTDLINSAITELTRIAPQPYTEDITPDGSQSYQLDAETAGRRTVATRVEIWTGSPLHYYARLEPIGESNVNSSDAGWRVWNGILYLTQGWTTFLADASAPSSTASSGCSTTVCCSPSGRRRATTPIRQRRG
jgi:hypothetical protein